MQREMERTKESLGDTKNSSGFTTRPGIVSSMANTVEFVSCSNYYRHAMAHGIAAEDEALRLPIMM